MDKSNMSGKAIWCHLISAFGRDTFLFEPLLLQTLSHEFLCQFNISCSCLWANEISQPPVCNPAISPLQLLH